VLAAWLRERAGQPDDPLFPTNRGGPLSRDAVEWLIAKHTATAADRCPSLRTKKVTAHVLRHTTAMTLLQSDVGTPVIALWLGHEQESTTRAYLHGDLGLKQRALDRTRTPRDPTRALPSQRHPARIPRQPLRPAIMPSGPTSPNRGPTRNRAPPTDQLGITRRSA
jgi:integrase/recombinase XerD